jgi:hypothetical protein
MMLRLLVLPALVAALAGCTGSDPYSQYLNERSTAGVTGPLPVDAVPADDPAALAAAEAAQSGAPLTAVSPVASAQPAAPAQPDGAISDEQDFAAVSSRETIESDRERLRAQREQYVLITPTALPERTGSSNLDIIDFALRTTNQPGQRLYQRRDNVSEDAYARACGRYASADKAQEAFLRAGGPERDSRGIDPDGDGFACGWDPRPFRLALN